MGDAGQWTADGGQETVNRQLSTVYCLLIPVLFGCSSMPKMVGQRDVLTSSEYVTLGDSYMKKGETEAAIRQYEAALRQDPKNIPALVALGNAAYEKKDYKTARKRFKRVLKIQPDDVAGINNLAMVDLAEGKNLEKAKKRLETALPRSGALKPYLEDTLTQINLKLVAKSSS